MKVLMVPSDYYPSCNGGVEVITQAISEGLIEDGYEVVVLCCANENQDYWHKGVHVIKIKPLNIEFGPIVVKNRINRLLQMYNPFHIRKINSIVLVEKPDIIHLHMTRKLSMSVITSALNCRVPIVSTIHEYFSLWNFDPFHKMEDVIDSLPPFYVEWIRHIHRSVTKRVQMVTSPQEKTFKKYQDERYYLGCKYAHIDNALPPIDKQKIVEYTNDRIRRKPRKLLMICRLMPFKGVAETLQFFQNNHFFKDWELHIAGDGPLRDIVEHASKSNSNIYYHGYVIDEEKEFLFNYCDVLVFLTTEMETYGLVVIEAFQHCMPVIVSPVEAMKKIVDDESNGLILSEVSEEAFIDCLIKLEQTGVYKNMVEEISRINWESKYSDMINSYENLYEEILRK